MTSTDTNDFQSISELKIPPEDPIFSQFFLENTVSKKLGPRIQVPQTSGVQDVFPRIRPQIWVPEVQEFVPDLMVLQ